MIGRRKDRAAQRLGASGARAVVVEGLEPRTLWSTTFQPDIQFFRSAVDSAAVGTTVSGYTPNQIRKAYGFDQIGFSGGTVAADGAGQTIAIVDAYNDPNIVSDLNVFSRQFNLPSANLHVVNQTGGSTLPSTDAGWAGEIALDVEWAHAMAPAANILLVEAKSAQDADLMAGVDYARHASGVSVVSMSWGGSEFVSYGGVESNSQLTNDLTFTTPAGHQGVTFVASAGDSGFSNGVQWPSSSPNVIAVGGTSLATQDTAGTYLTEGPWRGTRNGTSGGFSQVEVEPSYQQAAQQSGARSTPDVGYNGDPSTGFAVYDSVPYQNYSGWDVVGGTSAGSPQWAALIAIANQGRVQSGAATLDGRNDALPDLYSVYSAPGTAGYATYTSYFNDIGNDGYGYTTGLGTPHAAAVVNALLGTTGTTPTPTPTPTPAQLPASPLTVEYVTEPLGGIGGEPGTAKLRITNSTTQRFSGPVTITLTASADGTVSADDAAVTTLTLPKVNLRAGGSRIVKLKFDRPTGLDDGVYDYIAAANATGTGTADALAVSGAAEIAAARADLATTFADGTPIPVNPGKPTVAQVILTNDGNVAATGTETLTLYASADATLDGADTILTALPVRKVNLRAGKSQKVRVKFTAPAGAPGGTYYLIASVTPAVQPADADPSNDTAAVQTA